MTYARRPEPRRRTNPTRQQPDESIVPKPLSDNGQALAAVDELAVQPDREPRGDAIHELIRAGVSHEFGAALQRMLAEEAISEFSATLLWRRACPPRRRPPRQ